MTRLALVAIAAGLSCGAAGGAAADGSKLDVFRVGVDGKGRIDLTAADSEPDTSPRLSPDGKTVAYVRGDGRIWLMNADGSDQRPLFPPPTELEGASGPVWSPDAGRIAYDVVRPLPIPDYSVVVRDVTTGAVVHVFDDARDPTWSASGNRIAFESGTSHVGGYSDTLVSATLAGDERTLTQMLNVLSPAWSPNGKLIAFYGVRAGATPGLYVARPDGTGIRRLAGGGPPRTPSIVPTWSPDGTQVAFTTSAFRLRIVAVAAGRARTLGKSVAPSWSPGGTKLAAFAVAGGLQVSSSRTGKGRIVTPVTGGWYADPPAWSRDGKRLFFTSLSQ